MITKEEGLLEKNIKMEEIQFSTKDEVPLWWYDKDKNVFVIPCRPVVDIGPASAPYLGANLNEASEHEELDILVNQEHWNNLIREHSKRSGCSRKMTTGMGKQRLRNSFKILMASVLEKYEMAVENIKAHREACEEYKEARRAGMYY